MTQYQQNEAGLIEGYALVVGAQEETLQRLTALLWEHGIPAYAAPNAHESDKTVAVRGRPALVLLQMEKLEADSVVALESFRLQYDIPLLCVVPAEPRRPHVQALLQMATDFVVSPYRPQELFLRIRRICASGRQTRSYDSPSAFAQSAPSQRATVLSSTERRILACLSKNIGEPVSLEDLAALIPGATPETRLNLLRVHIFRLRQKIEPAPKNPIYIRTVRDYGYYLAKPVEGVE